MSVDMQARGLAATARAATAPLKLNAQKILRKVDGAKLTGALSPAPTVTTAASAATSTLASGYGPSAPSISVSDARIVTFGGKLLAGTPPLFGLWTYTNTATPDSGGYGWGQEFMTDGQAFELSMPHGAGQGPVRVRVNGQWAGSPLTSVGDGGWRYTKFDFGSRAARRIEVFYGPYDSVAGYNIGVNDRLWLVPDRADEPKVMFFGDSLSFGYAINDPGADIRHNLAECLGVRHVISAGKTGQGWAATVGTPALNFLDRINGGDVNAFGPLDLIYVMASTNDAPKTTGAITANLSAGVAKIMVDQPNAFICLFAGYRSSAANPDAAHNTAAIAGFNAVADPSRMFVANGYAPTPNLITVGGNDASYIGPDNAHPNPAGAAYIARWLVDQTATFIGAKA